MRKGSALFLGAILTCVMVPIVSYAADPKLTPMDEVGAMMIEFMKKAQEMQAFLRERDYVRSLKLAFDKELNDAVLSEGDSITATGSGAVEKYLDALFAWERRYKVSDIPDELMGLDDMLKSAIETGNKPHFLFTYEKQRSIEDIWIHLNKLIQNLEQDQKNGKMSRRDFLQLMAIRFQMGNIRRMVPAMIGEILPNGLDLEGILEIRAMEKAGEMEDKSLKIGKGRETLMNQFRPGQSFGLRPGGDINTLRPNSVPYGVPRALPYVAPLPFIAPQPVVPVRALPMTPLMIR